MLLWARSWTPLPSGRRNTSMSAQRRRGSRSRTPSLNIRSWTNDGGLSGGQVMLLCLSSRHWGSVFEEAVEAAGEVALEAAGCFAPCLAFLQPSFDVSDRGGV